MPRHPYQPSEDDKKKVRRLVSLKMPPASIAARIIDRATQKPISVDALREHFAEELALAHEDLFFTVADKYALRLVGSKAEFDKEGNQTRAEILPSESAQREFLKTFGAQYGYAGPTDDPFAGLDLTKLTDVELSTLKAIIAKCAIKPGDNRG